MCLCCVCLLVDAARFLRALEFPTQEEDLKKCAVAVQSALACSTRGELLLGLLSHPFGCLPPVFVRAQGSEEEPASRPSRPRAAPGGGGQGSNQGNSQVGSGGASARRPQQQRAAPPKRRDEASDVAAGGLHSQGLLPQAFAATGTPGGNGVPQIPLMRGNG